MTASSPVFDLMIAPSSGTGQTLRSAAPRHSSSPSHPRGGSPPKGIVSLRRLQSRPGRLCFSTLARTGSTTSPLKDVHGVHHASSVTPLPDWADTRVSSFPRGTRTSQRGQKIATDDRGFHFRRRRRVRGAVAYRDSGRPAWLDNWGPSFLRTWYSVRDVDFGSCIEFTRQG
jgi:hypothetical protein